MKDRFGNMNIRQRLLLLGAVFALVCILAYSLAIKETLQKKALLEGFVESTAEAINYPQQIQSYRNAIIHLDSIFKRDSVNISIRNKILRYAENYSDTTHIEIIRFQESGLSQQDNYTLVYNTLCLKGSYAELLRFYHSFESKEGSNKLISLDFYLKKEKYKKNMTLYSEGLIQSILYNEQ